MLHRIKPLFALLQGFFHDYWPYVASWFIITYQWAASMPEWAAKILVAVGTGFGLAAGKWVFEWVEKRFKA